jgi:hypothetical protein
MPSVDAAEILIYLCGRVEAHLNVSGAIIFLSKNLFDY